MLWLRRLILGGMLVGVILLWNGGGFFWGAPDAEFGWLLRRDQALLRREANPFWWQRPTLAWQQRRLDAAYRQFIRHHPEQTRALVAYGCFLSDHYQAEAAVAQWQRALAIDPRLAVAWNNLGEYAAHNGQIALALQQFEKAIELEPDRAVYHWNWATICSLYRRDARALYGWDTREILARSLAAFRLAHQLAPHDLEIARAYAEIFDCLPSPDWAEAYTAWQACAQQAADPVEQQLLYGRVARVAMRLRRFEEAERWIQRMQRPEAQPMRRALARKLVALRNGQPDTRPPFMQAVYDDAP